MEAAATDRRARPDRDLLLGVAARDPIAFADACARTLPAATAVCRRLLPAADLEPTLQAVYLTLWDRPPPPEAALAGWVRSRCFALGVQRLRERGAPPVAPSVAAAAPDLERGGSGVRDATERALAALDDASRRAVVRAHDAGIPQALHDAPSAPAGAGGLPHPLLHGLLALAGRADLRLPDVDSRVGDLVLGLLGSDEAAAVTAGLRVLEPARASELLHALRRGRQRLEGLPPPPDVGLRTVARILTTSPAAPRPAAPRPQPLSPSVDAARPEEPDAPSPRPEEPDAASSPQTDDPPDTTSSRPTGDPPAPQAGVAASAQAADRLPPFRPEAGRRPWHTRRPVRWLVGALLVLAGVAVGLLLVGPLVVELLTRLL